MGSLFLLEKNQVKFNQNFVILYTRSFFLELKIFDTYKQKD